MALICSGPFAMAMLSDRLLNQTGGVATTYAFSNFTRKPLNSGVYAFGSVTVGDSRFAMLRGTRPASS